MFFDRQSRLGFGEGERCYKRRKNFLFPKLCNLVDEGIVFSKLSVKWVPQKARRLLSIEFYKPFKERALTVKLRLK